jgi:hypothetical protein
MDLSDRVVGALSDAARPLSSHELASLLEEDESLIHEVIWAAPERFVWQPGHRWALAPAKAPQEPVQGVISDFDGRLALRPQQQETLRAITLEDGLELVVSARALDSDALYSVRSIGSRIELTLNSSHVAFSRLPLPFVGDDSDPYKVLVELLLEALALHEESLHSAAERRTVQIGRVSWGRKLAELIRRQ